MGRTIITPPGAEAIYKQYGFSPAVLSGDFLFLSGQVGISADGSVSDNPAEQIEQAFINLGDILKVAGATFDDVVDLTAFYINYKEHGVLARPIRDKYFGTNVLPNWTAVGVSALAEPFIFEVKSIARVPAR